jgi:hypothetical protein
MLTLKGGKGPGGLCKRARKGQAHDYQHRRPAKPAAGDVKARRPPVKIANDGIRPSVSNKLPEHPAAPLALDAIPLSRVSPANLTTASR